MNSPAETGQAASPQNRISAYFLFWSKSCEPAEVTARTALQPTRVWRIGDVRQAATGRRHEDNGWRLEGTCSSTDAIEPHVVALLNALEGTAIEWRDVCPDGQRQISIVIYTHEYIPALYLSAEVLLRVARVGASLNVDLYDLKE